MVCTLGTDVLKYKLLTFAHKTKVYLLTHSMVGKFSTCGILEIPENKNYKYVMVYQKCSFL